MLPSEFTRWTRLAALLAAAVGIGLLAVLPAQYGSLPVDLSLSMQAVVLYASAVAGPLLLAWGAFTFWDGTHRSLTTRRLLLALALSTAVIVFTQLRYWTLAVPGYGARAAFQPDVIPTDPYGTWPDLHVIPLALLVNPLVLGPVGIGFAMAATTLAKRGRSAALVPGTLATVGLLYVGAVVMYRVSYSVVLPLLAGVVFVPFLAGILLARRPTTGSPADRRASELPD